MNEVYISLIAGCLNLFIAGYVLSSNPKKKSNKVFTIFVLFISLFCFCEFLVRQSSTKELALLFGQIGYSVLPLGSVLCIHFSLVFPRSYPNLRKMFTENKYLLLVLYIIGILIYTFFLFCTSSNDVQFSEWGYRVNLNQFSKFILVWFLFGIVYALINFLHTYYKKNITFHEKKQIRLVTVGLLIIPFFSLPTSLLPPLYNLSFFPMTSIAITLFAFLVAYSMIKYKMMGLTLAETADVIVTTMSDSLLVVNENETIVTFNKSALNLLGYSSREIIGMPLTQIIKLSAEGCKNNKILSEPLFSKLSEISRLYDIEIHFISKNGQAIPMNVSLSQIYGDNKKVEGTVIVARDLTQTKKLIHDLGEAKNSLEEKVKERTHELQKINVNLENEISVRKKAENHLKSMLKEKELLVKEIHHRVKNNLQVISSILDLQADSIKDTDTLEIFKESQNRVRSMSLIHEQLYQSEDLVQIDFETYLQNLVINLFHSYAVHSEVIGLKINVEDVLLNIDEAISCGLIVNEIVTNALKHAFPKGKKGEITIDFRKTSDDQYQLIVRDNGVGLPADIDFKNTSTLGLQLVNILANQLRSNIELDRKEGTKYTILFSASHT